jgi:hypothetical protein
MAHRIPAVAIAALTVAASVLAQPAAPPTHITEELICERPMKAAERFFRTQDQVSSDLGEVVRVFERNVLVNCAPLGPPADEFLQPALSPDGEHVLRAGRQAKSWFVWLDAQQIAGPFDGVRRAHFAPDGRVIFAAKRAQAWTWFVDGQEQPVTTPAMKSDGALCNVELIGLWNIDSPETRAALEQCWSALIAVTRDRVAYPVNRTDGWHLVVDGQLGPPFERILRIVFSPDGSRLAYVGLRKDRVIAVVDGKEEPAHDDIEGLRFSADSKRVAYLAIDTTDGVTGLVVADGVPSRPYPALIQNADGELRNNLNLGPFGFWLAPELLPYLTGASAPLFRADGRVVYAARTTAPQHRYMVDGGGLETVTEVAGTTGQNGIWVEGAAEPLFQGALVAAGPVRSESGDHIGWVEWDAKAGRWTGFVDGQPSCSVPDVPKPPNSVSQLTLSHDGSRLAFVHVVGGFAPNQLAVHAPRRVVATGFEAKSHDAYGLIDLRLSDDGKHVAYVVEGAKDLGAGPFSGATFVVLDGVPGRAYAWVMPGTLRFVGLDTVRYVAVAQESKKAPFRYYRVTQKSP